MKTRSKSVMLFSEGQANMKELLGGKGANLSEMIKIDLPVPPGFTITTEACRDFYANKQKLDQSHLADVRTAMRVLEQEKQQQFGHSENPLLVSVRSGSVVSMPGMMDTILNLGLNDLTVEGLAKETDNPRFAYDCYRRLIQMFGNVVFGVSSVTFEQVLQSKKSNHGWLYDRDVTTAGWKDIIAEYKRLIITHTGSAFPQNVYEQLQLAVEAVFSSWNNQRAKVFRKVHKISHELGTAVNIQTMVFGNMGDDCCTGVVFTRNPSTGQGELYGEYLTNAQGEDVVSGARTPLPISQLVEEMPEAYRQLDLAAHQLELHYKDMQDIEFTVENGKLYILQTRSGKRAAQAAVKIAVDMVSENIIFKQEAIQRIDPSHLDQLLHRRIDTDVPIDVIAKGLPASPGAATGQAVFDADLAEAWTQAGKKVILVSIETTPEDIHGVLAAEGVLTTRGGMTSHAAVVARGMGKPCVCGCEQIRIDDKALKSGSRVIREGEWISIDGSTGNVFEGKISLKEPEISNELSQLLCWADQIRKLKVFTNADTPEDAVKAREHGAEGIGLCRTEHMFMSPQRIPVVQKMILSEKKEERQCALDELFPMQQSDFEGLFEAMDGLPVTIRLLDPPLHEFLPNLEELLERQYPLQQNPERNEIEEEKFSQLTFMIRKIRNLHETNPMLGQRGCRLGIVFPEIYEMQMKAIFHAATACNKKGIQIYPEIMIPLVGHVNELRILRDAADQIAEEILGSEKKIIDYKIGTMIEVPRAAITANQIAEYADFFSFGTNDLTQMTYGYSRDDAEGKFLNYYLEHHILPFNPFQTLDQDGVGHLIDWAVTQGRIIKPHLKTGICGEHGGDQESILICHELGLDYVSCSPYRVPFARIAAAQAQLISNHKLNKAANHSI